MNSRPGLTTQVVLSALFLCAVLFLPQTVFAGNGKFKDGKFDFCVSVRFNATPAQLQQIRDVFEDASRVLHDATDGHHTFGTITLVNNSGAAQAADFWVLPGSGRAYAPFFGNINYGVWGQHVTLYYNSDFGDTSLGDGLAYTIVHEFGHLAYGLEDEYSGPNPFSGFDAECAAPGTDTPTLSFCIMDNYFTRGARAGGGLNYSLNEFCSASTHDKAAPGNPGSANNTWQHFWHGESCWQSIAKNPKWAIPAPDPPIDGEGLSVIPTQQSGSPDKRFMLLIDRSGSMQDPGNSAVDSKMSIAQWAANGFITYAPDGMNIGVASFADSGILNFFMTPISPSNRGQAITAVNGLQAFGGTNIGHGLQIALAEIQAQTQPCCAQGIILISDGDHNTGTPPSAVIPALIDAGVTVFTIGLGTSITAAGEATLQDIATQTDGKYYRVNTAALLFQIVNSVLYAEALASGASNPAPLPIASGQTKEVPVLVEQGTTRASFVVNKINSTDSFSVLLRTPSGVLINPNDGAGGNPNIRYNSDTFSSGFQIFSPQAGTWTVIVTAGTITGGALNLQGLMEHEGTKLSAAIRNPLANYPQPLQIIASADWEGERVVGGTITGKVVHPQGASVPITLFDDGNMAHGDAIAGDGVYSENFDYAQQFGANYRSGTPIAGSYTIELTATFTNGTKYLGEVDLFPGTPPAPVSVPAFNRLVSTTAIITNVPTDTTAPSCQPTACNPNSPASCDITVQDTGVGLSLITVATSSNVNVSIPTFSAGTTAPVIVTGTLIDPNSNGSFEIQCRDVVGNLSTCSRTVTIAPPPILSDNFNDGVIDTAKWSNTASFTGFTSLLVPIAEVNQRIEIGPLLQSPSNQYRGLRSVSSFNFTGSNSYVELVQAPSSTTDAEALFNVGNNINNISLYYRIFVRHGLLIGERKTSATAKVTLFSISYDPVAHRFLRIRHNSSTGSLVLETAAGSSGVPGTWVTRYTEAWHSSIPLTSVLIEMRGGTFKQETTAPGKVIFDNFAFALNGP